MTKFLTQILIFTSVSLAKCRSLLVDSMIGNITHIKCKIYSVFCVYRENIWCLRRNSGNTLKMIISISVLKTYFLSSISDIFINLTNSERIFPFSFVYNNIKMYLASLNIYIYISSINVQLSKPRIEMVHFHFSLKMFAF